MADETISAQASKASPVLTDEVWLQATGGGATNKATVANLIKSMFPARGKCDTSANLRSGGVGIESVNRIGTHVYDWTLSEAVDTNTAMAFATANLASAGGGLTASVTFQSPTVVRVELRINYATIGGDHTLVVVSTG